jgi:small subunit ribosomal protein S4
MDVYGTGGDALRRRMGVPPGARPRSRRRRASLYGEQLLEKQKVRFSYGVTDSQLRRTFEEAGTLPGPRGENLLRLLERRLDNTIYRLGYARSRPMARQLVSHGHVRVDGQRVTIPSYRVSPGQTVGLTEAGARIPVVSDELGSGRLLPAWLERVEATEQEPVRARVTQPPARADVTEPIDESLVVGFYGR